MRVGLWRIRMVGLAVVLLALVGCGAVAPNQWQNVGPGNAQINTLAVDPHIRGIIFAGGSDGTTYVARGDRSGQFVASDKSPGGGPINVIFPNPYTKGTVYAGAAGGFFASIDYGEHYVARNSGLPSGANVTAITTGADATTLLASVAQHGIYTSADGGKTWHVVAPVASGASVALPLNVTVQSLLWDSSSKALYAAVTGANGAIYVSHDSGASWSVGNDGLPSNSSAYALVEMVSGGLAPSGPTLYAATSAGVFALTSGVSKWQLVGIGLPIGTIYSLATYPLTPGLLYAGTAQTVYASTDGGQHWAKVANGLAHAVPAIVVAPGLNTPTVTFAAAGQIVRYPAVSGGDASGGILSTLLLIVIVGAAAWFILARYRIVPSLTDLRRRLARHSA
jgi:photosystem II stability/assembly factor-like uncharacterized protein